MSSFNETNDNENDSDVDPCEALQQYVTLLLNQSPRKRMMISSLRFQIKETFDKSIKKLTGLKTKEFLKRMKERELIDIESVSEKNGSFDVVILRETENNEETEIRSPSSSEDESEDDSDCDDESDSTTSTQSANDTAIKSVALNGNSKIAESTELEQSETRKFNTKTDENEHTHDALENHTVDGTECVSNRYKGTVKLFLNKKGYGFIKWDGRDDLWFHVNDSQKENERVTFYDGDAVEFEIGKDRGKDAAINVVLDPDHKAPKFQGTCNRWNEERSFGFITRDDGVVDILLHTDDITNGDAIKIGDRVEFQCIKHWKHSKLRAVRARKIENESERTIDVVENHEGDQTEGLSNRHKGTIKVFFRKKGFGFITWNGGEDLYFHANDSRKEKERVKFYDGDNVEFEIGEDRGKDAAINVVLDPDHRATKFQGKCMRWNEEKGFGFITRDDGVVDILLHTDGISNGNAILIGDRVEFDCVINPKNGKLRAVRARKIENELERTIDGPDTTKGVNDEFAESSNLNQSKKRKISDSMDPPSKRQKLHAKDEESDTAEDVGREQENHTKERHKGIVRLFWKQKKYGFIKWDGGEDSLFHQNDIKKVDGAQPLICNGDYVEFGIGVGSNGRNRAIDVILDPDHTISRIRGKCISWNKEKGFGFIKRDDDGSDVFVHLGYIMDRKELQPNDRVEFEVVADPKNGKLIAIRAERIKESVGIQSENQSISNGSHIIGKGEICDSIKKGPKKEAAITRTTVNVPLIEMSGKGGSQIIERIMEELKNLEKHTISCHFVAQT